MSSKLSRTVNFVCQLQLKLDFKSGCLKHPLVFAFGQTGNVGPSLKESNSRSGDKVTAILIHIYQISTPVTLATEQLFTLGLDALVNLEKP